MFVYTPDKVEEQLDNTVKVFFEKQSFKCTSTKTIHLPKLCSWYVKDFKKKKDWLAHIAECLKEPRIKDWDIKYNDFDWEVRLDLSRLPPPFCLRHKPTPEEEEAAIAAAAPPPKPEPVPEPEPAAEEKPEGSSHKEKKKHHKHHKHHKEEEDEEKEEEKKEEEKEKEEEEKKEEEEEEDEEERKRRKKEKKKKKKEKREKEKKEAEEQAEE